MNIPSVSGPKLLPPLFPLDPLHYIESSSSKLQYRHDKIIYRPMGRVTSNRMHYLTVNYLTRSVPRHFHRSSVKLGVISCHDPVTKYIYMTVTSWISPSKIWISICLPSLTPVSSVRISFKLRAVGIWRSSIAAAYMAFFWGFSHFLFKIILWALFTEWLIKKKYHIFQHKNIEKKESMQKPGMAIFCW